MKSALAVLAGGAISGLLFCLALPPADVWWLGWVAFVPLLLAVRGKGFLAGFGGGLLSLFVCAFAARTGFLYATKDLSGLDAWIVTGCGLFGFVVSIAAGAWADPGAARRPLWWFPALAVVLEACLLVQLPAHIALTQYRQPPMMLVASVGGIWLVSYLVWFSNFWLATLIASRGYKLLILWALPLLGVALDARWPGTPKTIRVAVIQTDSTEEQTLTRLHKEASKQHPFVVVWPEFSGLALAPGGKTDALERIAKESSPFVTTFNDDFMPLPHNAAALFMAMGASERYFKRRLFGGEKNMHAPGDKAVAVHGVGLDICFDSCYPSDIRETMAQGDVVVIALPTIDPESPNRFIAAIHAAFTPFRAAEEGVPIARADGFSHSMIVDSSGQIVAELQGGQKIASAEVSAPAPTIYRRFGDWFLYLSSAAVVAGIFIGRTSRAPSLPE